MKTIKDMFIFGAVAVMSLLLGSCSKDSINSADNILPAGAMCIELSTQGNEVAKSRARLQTDAESKVTSARIFFYKESKLVKQLSTGDNGVSVDRSKIVIPDGVISPDNDYNIVVVANWTTGFNAVDYSTGSARSLLSDALTTITAPIPTPDDTHPLLMSGEIASHNFKTNPMVSVNLVRQAVKLVVNVKMGDAFKAAFPGAVFGSTAGNVLVSVLNVPTSSFVIAPDANAIYPTSVLDYNNLGMSFSDAKRWETTAYAYENPTMGTGNVAKAKATYFVLKLPYQLDGGDVVADNYYKFYINDVADAQNLHKTVRNTIYNVSVTITGFGSAIPDINGTQVSTKVLPWEGTITQTDPVGEYLKAPSSVVLEYGEDLILDVKASNLASVTATHTNTKVTFTNTNGVIKLRSDDMNTQVKTPDYDVITVTMGGLTKVITVTYRPHPGFLMAKYNLTANGGIITMATNLWDYGAHFKYGSLIATKGFDLIQIVNDPYDASDVLWAPKNMAAPASWTAIPMQSVAKIVIHDQAMVDAGKGDPCRLLGLSKDAIQAGTIDNHTWRLPSIKELNKINASHFTRSSIETQWGKYYWYSDIFLLYFPLAGCRADTNGRLASDIVHAWGLWQANSSGSYALYPNDYDTLTATTTVRPGASASPMEKAHSVRCIQQ